MYTLSVQGGKGSTSKEGRGRGQAQRRGLSAKIFVELFGLPSAGVGTMTAVANNATSRHSSPWWFRISAPVLWPLSGVALKGVCYVCWCCLVIKQLKGLTLLQKNVTDNVICCKAVYPEVNCLAPV